MSTWIRPSRPRPRWLGVILALGLSGPADAAEWSANADGACAAASVGGTDAAKEAFRAGQVAFNEGDYGQAVQHWSRAYDQDCTAHALLLNLATAQELLGRPDAAIHALRLFNQRAPDSPYLEANLKRIDRLQRAEAERAREKARRDAVAKPILVRPTANPSEPQGPTISLPLAVAGAGALMTLGGAALFVEGRYSASAASDQCRAGPAGCLDADAVVAGERARARAETGGWIVGTGLVTTAGGVLWHLLAERRPTGVSGAGERRWEVAISPTATELQLNGRF